MDVIIPDSWLRQFVKTKATPKEVARLSSLSGPSFERMKKVGKETVYTIEVTTNRVDTASVRGIAQEVAAILPTHGVAATYTPEASKKLLTLAKSVSYLTVDVDPTLCTRFTAVLIRDITIKPSPSEIAHRLTLVGERPINNIVDVTNYLMHELGQPMHAFDYDKIKGSLMKLRASRTGEKITTLDGKEHALPAGAIVIEDADKQLIDLAGIMGGELSAVDQNTKNVLLFVQTYNPVAIRRASMALAHRTHAATLFEKDLDPTGVHEAITLAAQLMASVSGGTCEKTALDLYPAKRKEKTIKLTHSFITDRMGVTLSKESITKMLIALSFGASWSGETLTTRVPTKRVVDVSIPEDIVEEVSRMYGYHNIPSHLMDGTIPEDPKDIPFAFETKVKQTLKELGGIEVYTSSLVSKDMTQGKALRLKNALGGDGEYLRTHLMPSLDLTRKENAHTKSPYHIFELSHVYIPQKAALPKETTMLAGMFVNTEYRQAAGVLEALCATLHIPQGTITLQKKDELFVYEIALEAILKAWKPYVPYKAPSQFPPQVEDITITIPETIKVGPVIRAMKHADHHVRAVELIDMYERNFTFHIEYHSALKTLTDSEVDVIRKKLHSVLAKEFGI